MLPGGRILETSSSGTSSALAISPAMRWSFVFEGRMMKYFSEDFSMTGVGAHMTFLSP